MFNSRIGLQFTEKAIEKVLNASKQKNVLFEICEDNIPTIYCSDNFPDTNKYTPIELDNYGNLIYVRNNNLWDLRNMKICLNSE